MFSVLVDVQHAPARSCERADDDFRLTARFALADTQSPEVAAVDRLVKTFRHCYFLKGSARGRLFDSTLDTLELPEERPFYYCT